MVHLLPCLITLNIVEYIHGRELNNLLWCFVNMQLVAYWAPLNLYGCLCILSCQASLNRTCIILDCASYHVRVLVVYYVVCWLFTMLCASFRCCFFGLVPLTSRLWGPVRLCPFVFFMDSFFFLAGFQARWPYPRNHFYLFLLVARSFAMPMLRYLPLAYHASHIVQPSL